MRHTDTTARSHGARLGWLGCTLATALFSTAAAGQIAGTAPVQQPVQPGARLDWVARYDGPAGKSDWVNALALGPDGCTVAVGYVESGFGQRAMATVSHDREGTQVWSHVFFAPGSDYGWAEDAAIDEAGNAYVTGVAYTDGDTGISVDIVTVKYSPTGELLWQRLYQSPGENNQPSEIKVNADGEVIVAGAAWNDGGGGHFDALLLKYDAAGNLMWERVYDRQPGAAKWDVLYAVTEAPGGQIIAVGWHELFSNWSEWLVMSCDAEGNVLWSEVLGGVYTNVDEAWGVAVDPDSGEIYVVGQLGQPYVSTDMAAVKYLPDGTLAWQKTYGGTSERGDYGRDIALDPQGNVIIAGTLWHANQPVEIGVMTAIKHDADGNLLWKREYVGAENYFGVGQAVAVDRLGEVYVTGYVAPLDGGGTYDLATVKWTQAGELAWVNTYNGPGDNDDEGRDIAVGEDLNVYVTGRSFGGMTSYYDIAVLKYAATRGVAPSGRID